MQPRYAKIVDSPFVRDMNNQAVINTDMSLVRKHELKMLQLQKESEREKEITSIKEEISEIKEMLKKILKGN